MNLVDGKLRAVSCATLGDICCGHVCWRCPVEIVFQQARGKRATIGWLDESSGRI
jgi:hypothetical protein